MSQPLCRICGAETDGVLCQDGVDEVTDALHALPGLIRELATVRARQTHVYKASMRARVPDEDWRGDEHALRPSAMLVDLDAAALLNDTIALWQSYRWAAATRSSLRTRDDAADIYRAVLRGHRRAERAVDRAPSAIWAGPCHAEQTTVVTEERDGTIYTEVRTGRCERDLYAWFAVWRDIGDEDDRKIECDGFGSRDVNDEGCGAVHLASDRRDWLRASVADSLVGIDEILDVLPRLYPDLPKPPKTVIQAWVRQGRLMEVGHTHVGEPSFVGRELLTLVEGYKPHRFAPRRRRGVA